MTILSWLWVVHVGDINNTHSENVYLLRDYKRDFLCASRSPPYPLGRVFACTRGLDPARAQLVVAPERRKKRRERGSRAIVSRDSDCGGPQAGVMGFFVVTLQRRLHIHPRFFGVKLHDILTRRLVLEVEGTFEGRYGFIVAVLHVQEDFPPGELEDGTGFAVFPVQYQAVVFRPFKGEVMDTVVSRLTKFGFFAEAGPLTIFVSHHLLPAGFSFNSDQEIWFSHDGVDVIKLESNVRLRIIGLKIEASEISATGTIKDNFLGCME